MDRQFTDVSQPEIIYGVCVVLVAVLVTVLVFALARAMQSPSTRKYVPRDDVDRLVEALELCCKLDKTVYDYGGSDQPDRNGGRPPRGERFRTPREIATAALAAYRKAVKL